MAMNFSSKISTLLIAASVLLVAACSSGDSGTSGGVSDPIGVSLASLDAAMTAASTGATVVKDAPSSPASVQHGRFVRRMLLAHARQHDVTAQAHLAALMWHVADMRKYGAIPEQYGVPMNTALRYITQLFGGARAAAFRKAGQAEVSKAEFDAAVAQIAAMGSAGNASPQAKEIQATKLAVSKKDTSSCSTADEISEDVGVFLANAAHEIPEYGWAAASLIDIFWPSGCSGTSSTDAIQKQIDALNVAVTANTYDICQSSLNTLAGSSTNYSAAINAPSPSKQQYYNTLTAALKNYNTSGADVQALNATAANAKGICLPLYANYVSQYIMLLQDYIKNAATDPTDCRVTNSTADADPTAKWCSAYGASSFSLDKAALQNDMCLVKKELYRLTYDPDNPTVSFSAAECGTSPVLLTGSNDPTIAGKQWVLATMQNSLPSIVTTVTASTSAPNVNMLNFNATNAWTRVTTLSSQDQAMNWPWLNILKYPQTPCATDSSSICSNSAIPNVIVTREVYSDIIGVIRDNADGESLQGNDNWVLLQNQPGLTNAQDWLDNLTYHRNKPYYGPITTVDVFGWKGHCPSGCEHFGSRVWDIRITTGPYQASGNISHTSKAVNPGGSDDQTTGIKANGMKFSVPSTRALYSFTARVITDADTGYTRNGIPSVGFYFTDNGFSGSRPVDPGSDSYIDGHVYNAPDLASAVAGETVFIFGIPGHIISQITPYGITWADSNGFSTPTKNDPNRFSLNAFIVGYRPYNAWGN